MKAHVLAEQVERALLHRFPGADVLIHQDPSSVVPKERHAHWEL